MNAVTVIPSVRDAGAAAVPPKRRWNGLILPAALILLWEGASQSGLVDARLLPSLGTVAARGWSELAEGRLALDIASSLGRDLAGFAIGSVFGILAGLALGLSRTLDRYVGPTFNAVKQIAVFAWIPLISVWFGVGEAAKVAFIALAAFTPVVVNTWAGARSVPRDLSEVADVLMLSRWQRLTRLEIPSALPSIFVGLQLGLIYSWLATVGAEYFMTVGPGIGGLMTEGREHFHMDVVILGVLLLGGIGLGLNRLAGLLETGVLRWKRF
jgi:sulfonate transport system permease protein